MNNIAIYKKRIRQLKERVAAGVYGDTVGLSAEYIHHPRNPIPYEEALKAKYKPIKQGTRWGNLWACAWFRFRGTVPQSFAGKEVVALIDVGGEGCVFENGEPVLGLTHADGGYGRKRRVPVSAKARGGETVDILVEAGANGLFGDERSNSFTLRQAEIAIIDSERWLLSLDIDFLLDLLESLPQDTPRFQKILRGLNRAANVWADGAGLDECRRIAAELLSSRANASSMTAWSIGHAHIDLGWLWPVRETIRKGGRTFSTALRLMEEYPEYRFGASQPQLYWWMKERYPGLYAKVKRAVAEGRWEIQGAMWVEPDMNVTGGESLVRQCLYGKKFFREEFGKEEDNLWLPDVFGYNAALPQILKKSDVNYFVTQKISWNETNTFPHHTFRWVGIDGTEILTHFLPTNNYNCDNLPSRLIAAEKRFAQSDVQDDFLNLYGIGDGGGGPSRAHIELGTRMKSCEGAPKVKFAFAGEFLKKIGKTPKADLPLWHGELYLELHRGTYTTQARMKKYNRTLELALRDVEFLSVAAGRYPKDDLDAVWRDTLLNQFHDILPGSSIAWVYEDAHALSEKNIAVLSALRDAALSGMHPVSKNAAGAWVVYNTLSWRRTAVVMLPVKNAGRFTATDGNGKILPSQPTAGGLLVRITLPSMGYGAVKLTERDEKRTATAGGPKASENLLENSLVRVRFGADGTVISIYDKKAKRETLAGPANRLLLWEDHPYSWDAWDISHYYRETAPQAARLVDRTVEAADGLRAVIRQTFEIGNSKIVQRAVLTGDSPVVSFENTVDWNEEKRLLRVQAECALANPQATFEIQYGTVKRTVNSNTTWEQAQFEVAGHRFADLSDPDYGMALLNDCKYGYYVKGNVLDLTLLRSPKSPDPTADIATHTFTYAYLPHQGRLEDSEVMKRAHELNSAAIVWSAADMPEAAERTFFSVVTAEGDDSAVKIEAVKQAEDGRGTIVRLYEPIGKRARVTFNADGGWKEFTEVNLVERVIGKPKGPGDAIILDFNPFEIRTFLLER